MLSLRWLLFKKQMVATKNTSCCFLRPLLFFFSWSAKRDLGEREAEMCLSPRAPTDRAAPGASLGDLGSFPAPRSGKYQTATRTEELQTKGPLSKK